MDNNLRLLGIARKAGLLAVGDEAARMAARSKKARAVFSASDASDGAKRRARAYAGESGAVHVLLPYTRFELGSVVGRGLPGTVAVLDAGIAAGFVKGIAASGEYSEEAELLDKKVERALRRKKEAAAGRKNTGAGKRRTAQ